MPFQVIKAEARVASMVQWFQGMCDKITDFAIGSKFRTKFESVAVEMERQDYEFEQAVRQAIPVSCYQTFGFGVIPATRASGPIQFSSYAAPIADIRIPKGTQLATIATSDSPEKIYETTADVYMLAGESIADATVLAQAIGTEGNTSALTITVMKSAIPGIDLVTNTESLENGSDEESEDARRIRFVEYIASLDRSTGSAVEYGAKTAQLTDGDGNVTEKVMQAKIFEPYLVTPALPAADIICHIHNGSTLASDELVDECQRVIDGYVDLDGTVVVGWKAAGVICTVEKATLVPQDVTGVITVLASKTTDEIAVIEAEADRLIRDYFKSLRLEEKLLKSKLIDIVMGIDGVYNVSFSAPAADVTRTTGEVTVIGTIDLPAQL